MITPERIALYKKQAIAAVAARAKNLKAPGITMIAVSPHDLLRFIECLEAQHEATEEDRQ